MFIRNLHEYSSLNNFIMKNIKVSNIVCTVDNLLPSCFLMHSGKLTDIVCIVEYLLTSCVLWKIY